MTRSEPDMGTVFILLVPTRAVAVSPYRSLISITIKPIPYL